MTQAVPHLVNRLVIDTEDTFDNVRRRYESLVPAIDFAELAEVAGTGDLAALQAYIAAHTPTEVLELLSDAGCGSVWCRPDSHRSGRAGAGYDVSPGEGCARDARRR